MVIANLYQKRKQYTYMKEGCVMGRTIGIVTVALVLAFFGEMASVLNITTQCLLMQRSFWKYYYYIQTAAGGHGCSRTLLLLQQPKQQHTLEKFLPFGQDVYSRFCIEKKIHTHMLLDITFLFNFSSSKQQLKHNPAEEKYNS